MTHLPRHLAHLLVTAWVGSLWSIGYVAVPTLFYMQPDKQLAGMLAGQMFSLVAYLGILCGTYLVIYRLSLSGRECLRSAGFWLVVAMVATSLAFQFGLQPLMADLKARALPLDVMHSPFAGRFMALHGISSAAYLTQSLLGIFLVIKSYRD